MTVQSPSEPEHTPPARPSRRSVLGLAVGLTLTSIGVPAGLAAAKPPRKRLATPQLKRRAKPGGRKARGSQPKPRFKIVTRTYHIGSAIVINDKAPASPYPSVITVAGLRRGKLLDLNVTLHGFTHTTPRDVDLLLVAPNGRSAAIMSDVGDVANDEAINLILGLDDQPALPLPATERLFSGYFRPQNVAVTGDEADLFPVPASFSPNVALATFNGINPNGTWQLFVVDDVGGDSGSIASWSLTIQAQVQVPRRRRRGRRRGHQ